MGIGCVCNAFVCGQVPIGKLNTCTLLNLIMAQILDGVDTSVDIAKLSCYCKNHCTHCLDQSELDLGDRSKDQPLSPPYNYVNIYPLTAGDQRHVYEQFNWLAQG